MNQFNSIKGRISFMLIATLLQDYPVEPEYPGLSDHGAVSSSVHGSLAGTPHSLAGAGLVNSNQSVTGSGTGSAGTTAAGQHSEQQAIIAIEKAYSKPVAFSVRTNVMYDGTLDDDSPVHGCAVR